MKKSLTTIIICLAIGRVASAQNFSPSSFEFGAKAGVNLSYLPQNGVYNNTNKAGYLIGIWARAGDGDFQFEPEAYITDKRVKITDNTFTRDSNDASFTSLDIPLLASYKIGAAGIDGRLFTGPLFSFRLHESQDYPSTSSTFTEDNFVKLDYNNVNYGWIFGIGADFNALSVDLRYEGGINRIPYSDYRYSHTRMSLFQLTVAYRIFSL